MDQLLFRLTADLDKRGVAKTCGAESTAELLQSTGLVAPAAPTAPSIWTTNSAKKVSAALDPWTTPVPETDGSPDSRSRAQLHADALNRLLDSFFAQEDRPIRGGVKPHVNLTLSPEHLINLQMDGITGFQSPTPAVSFEWAGPVSASTAQMDAPPAGPTRTTLC